MAAMIKQVQSNYNPAELEKRVRAMWARYAIMTVRQEIKIVVGRERVEATRTEDEWCEDGYARLDQLRLATIKLFEEMLLTDTILTRRHMVVLGQQLYAGIFDEPIERLVNMTLNDVKADRLRLQLQFKDDVDPLIPSLPWEFLYSPARDNFLATDVNLVLSRFVRLAGQGREVFSPLERPLRALVVISRPQDERTVLAKDVVEKIDSLNVARPGAHYRSSDGKDKPALIAQASKMQLSNLHFTAPLPKIAMSDALAAADACIDILKPIPLYATVYPNKVFNYMAAGRPVILAIDGVIRILIEESGAGLFVQPGDATTMAAAILHLAAHPQAGREMGIRGRKLVEERYNRPLLADQLAQLMEDLVIRYNRSRG